MQGNTAKRSVDNKKNNRGLVFQLIATGECSTRGELVQQTGLTRMAISKIVTEMLAGKLLEETELIQKDESGRRAMGLKLSSKAPKIVGLQIDRRRCRVVLCDLSLNVIRRDELPIQADMNESKLREIIFQLLDTALLWEKNILAIGVSSIGPISKQRGMILEPYYFYDIKNVELVHLLEQRYKMPVFFDHDNQSGVALEKYFGLGRDFQDIMLVTIGIGVGCGVISNSRRFDNFRGLPPEIGHVSINYKGPRCQCGNCGCVESYIRTPEVMKRFQSRFGRFYSYETFCRMNDPVVDEILSDSVSKLATALSSVINVINSELVILGGDCNYWDERYITLLEEKINEGVFVSWDKPVQVKRSSFGNDYAVIGAACNVLQSIFEGELLFE